MNYRDFFKLINTRGLNGAYLLYGNEEFVKEKAIKAAVEIIPADLRAFNTAVLTDAALDSVRENCETLPLFTGARVIVCLGIAEPDDEKLCSYLDKIPDTAVLLIVVKGVLQEKSALLKYFKKLSREVLFSELSEYDVAEYCVKTAMKQGAALDMRSARFFAERVGTDMTAVVNELQKAIDAVGEGGKITPEVISSCTSANTEYRVFEMLDYFTSGKLAKGIRALHGMLSDENEALGIAAFLESRFKLMLEAKALLDAGLSVEKAASRMEGNKYANKKACLAAKKYSAEQLRELVKQLSLVGYTKMSGGAKADALTETIMLNFNW